MTRRDGSTGIVGRDDELSVLMDTSRRGHLGVCTLALVRGEAGIGKSRLVRELADRLGAQGWRVIEGRGDEADYGVPYATIRHALAATPIDTVMRTLDDVPADADVGDHEITPARFVTDVVISELAGLAAARPVLLVLDDVHAADHDTVALLGTIARRLERSRLVLAVTTRPVRNWAADTVGALTQRLASDDRAVTIELGALDAFDVGGLVAAELGDPPDDALLALLDTSCGGNPFFIIEMLRGLRAADAIVVANGYATTGDTDMAGALQDERTILDRVFGNDIETRRVGALISVAGRIRLERIDLVAELAAMPRGRVVEIFDSLVDAGILASSGDDTYEFSHPILREALYDSLGPAGRAEIHGAFSKRLEAEREQGSLRSILELGRHVVASAHFGDERAIELLVEVARRTGESAPLSSAGWYQRAADLMPEVPERSVLQAEAAQALWRGFRPTEAAELGYAALRHLEPGRQRSRTVIAVANSFYACGTPERGLEVLERELGIAASDRRQLQAVRANLLIQCGRGPEVDLGALLHAEERGEPESDSTIALTHIAHGAATSGQHGIRDRALTQLGQRVDTARPGPRLAAIESIAWLAGGPGCLAQIDTLLDRAATLRNASRGFNLGGQYFTALVRHRWLSGQWEEALDVATSLAAEYELAGTVGTYGFLQAVAASILAIRGELAAATHLASGLVCSLQDIQTLIVWVQAEIAATSGHEPVAAADLQDRWTRCQQLGILGYCERILSSLADYAGATGNHVLAREAARDLSELADGAASPLVKLISYRVRANAYSDPDAAAESVAIAAAEGMPFEEARGRLTLGELSGSTAELGTALEIFDRLKADRWRRRVATVMRSRGTSVPRLRRHTIGSLTRSETQLARLVVEGLNNKEIGATLFLSRKTVEAYLTRLYAKTGCSSRLALVRAIASGVIQLDTDES